MLRWLALGTLAVVALLYYRPVKSYMETRSSVDQSQAEVRDLRARRDQLARRLADADTPEALERRARKLGLVRPGEQLFIIKGIPEWRRRAKAR
ncbi:MAG TPA: septum formation initiator family protein [Gaiellaceae bacterium]